MILTLEQERMIVFDAIGKDLYDMPYDEGRVWVSLWPGHLRMKAALSAAGPMPNDDTEPKTFGS